MPARHPLALVIAVLALASGCGGGKSSTRTVTVNSAPPAQTATSAAPDQQTTATTPSSSCGACATSAAQAVAIVRGRGYQASPSGYEPRRPLNVLVGLRSGSADGTAQRAFFFWNGRFLGMDAADESAGIRVESQSGDTAALTYRLYNPKDPQCCATGGTATVRFRFEGSRLVPLDPIPPSSYGVAGSRR